MSEIVFGIDWELVASSVGGLFFGGLIVTVKKVDKISTFQGGYLMPKNIRHGNPLTAAMEDYLEAIYHIAQKHGYARSGQISKRLNVHKSTVTTALHQLQVQGYIEYEPYQEVRITPKGELEAKGIVRRHDIFFRLLHNLLEIEQEEASKLACELEHALPPDVVDRFVKLVEKALRNKNEAYAKIHAKTKTKTKKTTT